VQEQIQKTDNSTHS